MDDEVGSLNFFQHFCWQYPRCSATVEVPCRPLRELLPDAGLPLGRASVDFLSLDVEGAESLALAGIDPAVFKLILVELDGLDVAKDQEVHRRLVSAGLQLRPAASKWFERNRVYTMRGLELRPPLRVRRNGECVQIQPPGLSTSNFLKVC